MRLSTSLLALIGLLLCGLVLGQDKAYRWVDKHGQVHYGDIVKVNATVVKVRPAPPVDTSGLAELQVERDGDNSDVYVNNRIAGPLEIELTLTDGSNVQSLPQLPVRQVLQASQRSLISRIGSTVRGRAASYDIGMTSVPGDPHAIPDHQVYALPVDENSGWELGQAFNGSFSHNDEQNRFAVDLIVNEGTPVLAARGGVVMMVQTGFVSGGSNRAEYVDRANVIRILHDDGSMGVYAHLQKDSALVKIGQRVSLGEVIAYSGNTGYTSGPHLHFCVQVNRGMRLLSIPFRMVGPNGFLPLMRQ